MSWHDSVPLDSNYPYTFALRFFRDVDDSMYAALHCRNLDDAYVEAFLGTLEN